jgi:hypothetical protein
MDSSAHSSHDRNIHAYIYTHVNNLHHVHDVNHPIHNVHQTICNAYFCHAKIASTSTSFAHGRTRCNVPNAKNVNVPKKSKNASIEPCISNRTFDVSYIHY